MLWKAKNNCCRLQVLRTQRQLRLPGSMPVRCSQECVRLQELYMQWLQVLRAQGHWCKEIVQVRLLQVTSQSWWNSVRQWFICRRFSLNYRPSCFSLQYNSQYFSQQFPPRLMLSFANWRQIICVKVCMINSLKTCLFLRWDKSSASHE